MPIGCKNCGWHESVQGTSIGNCAKNCKEYCIKGGRGCPEWILDPDYIPGSTTNVVKAPSATRSNSVLKVSSKGVLIRCLDKEIVNAHIPEGVVRIGNCVFKGCESLASVTIPKSVTSIGFEAFSGSGLKSITIPSNVTAIGEVAFYCCKHLTSVTILGNITSIRYGTFMVCRKLSTVTIPRSVTSIEPSAFNCCDGLISISNLENVITIEDNAFYGCSSLKSISSLKNVTSIGEDAFYNCKSLESMTLPNVTSIGDHAFGSCPNLDVCVPSRFSVRPDRIFY